jgi:hypothetical protein
MTLGRRVGELSAQHIISFSEGYRSAFGFFRTTNNVSVRPDHECDATSDSAAEAQRSEEKSGQKSNSCDGALYSVGCRCSKPWLVSFGSHLRLTPFGYAALLECAGKLAEPLTGARMTGKSSAWRSMRA